MKRSLIIASALCFAAFLGACSDDKNSTRYCDAGFTDKCENGFWLKCDIVDGKDYRAIVELEAVKIGGIDYVCNDKDVLVAKDLSCQNGKIVQSDATKSDHFCDTDGNIVFCNGDAVTAQKAYCKDNAAVYCAKASQNADYSVRSESCGNSVCEEFERGVAVVANCFEKSNVSNGCGNVTAYGSCNASAELTFCSSETAANGKTLRLDCNTVNLGAGAAPVCALIDEAWGYDCTALCGKTDSGKDVSYHGRCDGSVLSYCAEDSADASKIVPTSVDCSEFNQTCGLDWSNPLNPVFNCIGKT